MNIVTKSIITSLLIISSSSHAFIYRIDVLKRSSQAPVAPAAPIAQVTPAKEQHIICLSDFHDKTHPQTHNQQGYLEVFLDKLRTKNAKVHVEDLSSPNTVSGHSGCGTFSVNSRGGILGGLSETCQEKKVPVDNVEYRFCRVAGFGPVLNNVQQSPASIEPANKITIGAIHKEVERAIEQVKLFRDGPAMQKYYNESINDAFNALNQLQLLDKPQTTIADYLTQQTTPRSRLDILKQLLTFDSELLDMNFIHGILQAQDKDIIVIIAGGAHISNVCTILEKIGYVRVYNTPVSYIQERNLAGCIGSRIIDEKYCLKPEAVNLQEIDKYVDTKNE